MSESLLPSKIGSLEGQKSERLCSSSFLVDSDEEKRETSANEALISDQLMWVLTNLNNENHFQGPLSDAARGKGRWGWKASKTTPGTCRPPIQRVTIKHIEVSGPAVTLLTSHLFEPEQLRGLHLWWHDPSHPAQDPVASICYTSRLLFGPMVHPHHHVSLSVTWRSQVFSESVN